MDIQNLSVVFTNKKCKPKNDADRAKNETRALDHLNLKLQHKNSLVGVVAQNGAGKTTLFKVMLGALRPTEGRVLLGGKTPQEFTQKYFKQVAVVFQDNIAFNKFTVMDQMNLMNIVMEEHKSSDDLLKMLE